MGDNVDIHLGRYHLVERIGGGGMGEVYRARHELIGKAYAVKLLPDELARDPNFIARFRDEACVMAELRHPGIVQVHAMDFADGRYFLAMDYVTAASGRPETLGDYLGRQALGRLSEAEVRKWAVQIAEALAYAHGRGVVHRDIKPGNLLLDERGNLRLTDFGLAKAIGSDFILSQIHESMKTLSAQRTRAARPADDTLEAKETISPDAPASGPGSEPSGILGTYDYMAPEQRGEGTGRIDQRTDLYALGKLIYRMLTGRRVRGFDKPPSQAVPGISKRWDAIVTRCVADDPDDRYPSADALLQDLRRVIGVAARRAVRAAAVAILLIAAGALLTWHLLLPMRPADPPRRRPVAAPRPAPLPVVPTRPARMPTGVTRPAAPPPVTLADVVPLKTAAEMAWEKVKALDRGEGFGALLDAAEASRRSAETFLAAKSYAEAKQHYEQLAARTRQLAEREPKRQAAFAARAKRQQAADAAKAARADQLVAPEWGAAGGLTEQGADALAAGRLDDAAESWSQAAQLYDNARTRAEALTRVAAARQTYEAALAKLDAKKLAQYGGVAWQSVQAAVRIAESAGGDDVPAAVAAYDQATELLPTAAAVAEVAWRDARVAAALTAAREHVQVGKFGAALKEAGSVLSLRPTDATALALRRQIREKLTYAKWPFDAKEAARRQQETAARLGIKPVLLLDMGKGVTMKLVLIPPGRFLMGSKLTAGETARKYRGEKEHEKKYADEHPQHQVTISKAFYMGVFEVTRGQFAAFVSDTSYETELQKKGMAVGWDGKQLRREKGYSWREVGIPQTDDHPAVNVSHKDAVAFCQWLGRKAGREARLPTEGEWEYACRAGTATVYQWGDDPNDGKGWCNGADKTLEKSSAPSSRQGTGVTPLMPLGRRPQKKDPIFTWPDGYRFTAPVGRFRANSFGLFDMHGNVFEWCTDWYGSKSYASAAVADPQGPASGTSHVARGGCWASYPHSCRSAFRGAIDPQDRDSLIYVGFRVVVSTGGD